MSSQLGLHRRKKKCSVRRALLIAVATAVSGCAITGPSDELFRTPFHIEGTVASSIDGSAVSGATVSLVIGTIDGLVPATTVLTDAMGRYVVDHSFNLGKDVCPGLWMASTAAGHVATPPRDPRYPVMCGVATQTINIALTPVS
jgi:hypothetical protein